MKKKSSARAAFFNFRLLLGIALAGVGVFLALASLGIFSKASAQTGPKTPQTSTAPEIVRLIGPVSLGTDLRDLPYIAPKREFEERALTRHPHPAAGDSSKSDRECPDLTAKLLKKVWQPEPTIPSPLLTFDGVAQGQSACGCEPPDTDGDVGPNHYVQAVNSVFTVYDKSGNTLAGPTTYNSLFAPLVGTPCNGLNDGDPYVLYDPTADRWLVSDFAFPSFPGTSFYQCIAVSKTSSPVTGGWNLYALQVDPGNPTFLGDYPKFGFWNNPQPGGAYFVTMNLFSNSTTFNGVRAYALDRASMLSGGAANAVGFTIPTAGLGDSYSLVPATFRTGSPPPAGRDEFLLAIDSPASQGVTLTTVKGWLFHVNFAGGSTLGVGVNHSPNSLITVNGFIDAFTNSGGFSVIPQQGTSSKLDSLGDKIMTPLVYQNLSGTESLWASGTVCTDANCIGQTGIRWYQFNVTGGGFPATPVQQQTWTNGNDGVWRFMPSIAVDSCGNAAIGYSGSSSSMFPGIRYAGRLATDPLNNLGQGEAIMFSGTGSQTGNRWGDYSMTTVDPTDGATFWHANEYYGTTSNFNWRTRIGNFKFTQCGGGGGATLVSAASRVTHGSAGTFDVPMPISGTSGVEDRSTGGNYTAVFTYNTAVTSGTAVVFSGTATAGTPTFNGNEMRVPLTGVANEQIVTIRVGNVNGGGGSNNVPFGFLIADVNSNRLVDKPDFNLIKAAGGQPVTAANFRDDVDTNGFIRRSDGQLVKAHEGESIP